MKEGITKIVLASANQGKIKEIKNLLNSYEVIAYSDILGKFDIPEDGSSFKQNAIIKAKTVYDKLQDKNIVVISDDSGITVPALNNEPNIYSARYAGVGATDKQNNEKLISKLKQKNIAKTDAHYTACIAMIYKDEIYTTHGWMYGDVIDKTIGDGGFGYDPMFIPKGYNKTLGELEYSIKKNLSHRVKALNLISKIAKVVL
jgi:XTP/dITP diphosphohydrolase